MLNFESEERLQIGAGSYTDQKNRVHAVVHSVVEKEKETWGKEEIKEALLRVFVN